MFIVKLLSRCTHVTCTILLFTLIVAPFFSPPDVSKTYPAGSVLLHFGDVVAVTNPARLSMILVVAIVVSGLYNAHALGVAKTLAHSANDRLRWRMQVYFMKPMLLLSLSPVLEKAVDAFSARVEGGMAPEIQRQTCAVTRAFVVLLLAGLGSYCKTFREDSIRREAAHLETKKK